MIKKKLKERPPRLLFDKKTKRYYVRDGKRKLYVKGINQNSNSNRINIVNKIVMEARKRRTRKSGKKLPQSGRVDTSKKDLWLPYFLTAKFSGSNQLDELARRLQSGQINMPGQAPSLSAQRDAQQPQAPHVLPPIPEDNDPGVEVIPPPPRARRLRILPEGDDALSKLKLPELKQMAKNEGIVIGKKNKAELVQALRDKEQQQLNESVDPQVNTPFRPVGNRRLSMGSDEDLPSLEMERKSPQPRSRTSSQRSYGGIHPMFGSPLPLPPSAVPSLAPGGYVRTIRGIPLEQAMAEAKERRAREAEDRKMAQSLADEKHSTTSESSGQPNDSLVITGGQGSGRYAKKLFVKGSYNTPLFDTELISMLSPYKDFVGVIMKNELKGLLEAMLGEGRDRFGFVINSEPNTKEGKHWMACYVDLEGDKSIGFFDPFGEKMDPQIREDLKEFVEKKGVPWMIKFKENRVKHQAESSNRCGYHCARFLITMFKSQNFEDATDFDSIQENEKEAKDMAKSYEEFGYV